ncbi:beta-ketoacyl-[acyl-carrier-protein] synthase family protein [Burkholderia anthina]|uniref:beta-ketoacyl-[acyl-carrier-protein] synthase family protein n=1 Tax=Burkholderia anthina TaxID=179879 RepID=UPI00158A3D5F|nr:beta-ketoacyl-[acyl-carrier-protein] synthase family protein [Burkholderia anthina]
MERVVITGIGVVSCLGQDLDTVATALREGRSGVVRDPEREALGFQCALTGAITGFDPAERLSRKDRRGMAEPALYGAVAALRALDDATLSRDALRRPEAGVIVGNDSSADAARRACDDTRSMGTTRLLGSSAVVEAMNSSASMCLSVLLGTKGACWTVSGACASGAHAIGQASMLIESGRQDIVVVGGVQELNWAGMCAFDGLGAFSTWSGEPAQASRPFSANRDGLVPSGGGAMLVLESLRHAQSRSARVRAMLRSYAFSSDGRHLTLPDGEGARRCMRDALRYADFAPADIDYVNAHATATPSGDTAEAAALRDVFGDARPPVSSTKGMTGHECWMAGASEVAYSLLMAQHGFIAANANLVEPDPACAELDLVQQARDARVRTIMSNSFGFGGTNASIILEAASW